MARKSRDKSLDNLKLIRLRRAQCVKCGRVHELPKTSNVATWLAGTMALAGQHRFCQREAVP